MNILNVIGGQAVRLIDVTGVKGPGIHGVQLARAMEARYGFLESPRTVEEFNLESGITFRHGDYNGNLITRFQVYSDGILAEAQIDTDICDAFIDDVISWTQNESELKLNTKEPRRVYVSTFDLISEMALNKLFSPLDYVTSEISSHVKSYSGITQSFEFNTLQAKQPGPSAPFFKVEKKTGQAEGMNVYNSTAPLRTSDHIRLIEKLEKTVMEL